MNTLTIISILAGLGVGTILTYIVSSRTNKANLENLQARCQTLETDKAAVDASLELSQKNADELRGTVDELREISSARLAELSGLKSTIESERKNSDDRIEFLSKTSELMESKFKNLADEIVDKKTSKIDEDSKKNIAPFVTELTDLRKRIAEYREADTSERSVLADQVKALRTDTRNYNERADDLVKLFKGDNRVQGAWGEVQLKMLLDKSGMREGVEYTIQANIGGFDNRLRPDCVINLPDGKNLIIDSKVSLKDYSEYFAADNDAMQKAALARHVQSIKSHVDGLAKRNYSGAEKANTPDFVFMFMPMEQPLSMAIAHAPDIIDRALEKNIVICTPMTLIPVLRTVERLWRSEKQNINSVRIAECAEKMLDKFVMFAKNLEDIGDNLASATITHEKSMRQLSTGNGNLVKQARRLSELGVSCTKVKKMPVIMSEILDTHDSENANNETETPEITGNAGESDIGANAENT